MFVLYNFSKRFFSKYNFTCQHVTWHTIFPLIFLNGSPGKLKYLGWSRERVNDVGSPILMPPLIHSYCLQGLQRSLMCDSHKRDWFAHVILVTVSCKGAECTTETRAKNSKENFCIIYYQTVLQRCSIGIVEGKLSRFADEWCLTFHDTNKK